MLPAPYTWHNDGTGKNRLTFHYGWVATVEADGMTRVCGWGVEHQVKTASAAQGRRFVERWIKARRGARDGKNPETVAVWSQAARKALIRLHGQAPS